MRDASTFRVYRKIRYAVFPPAELQNTGRQSVPFVCTEAVVASACFHAHLAWDVSQPLVGFVVGYLTRSNLDVSRHPSDPPSDKCYYWI